MRTIDADAYLESVKPRGISDELWKESNTYKSVASMPTIEPEQKTCEGCMWEDAYGYGSCPNCSRAYREDLYLPMT